jgi:hypothetical protein
LVDLRREYAIEQVLLRIEVAKSRSEKFVNSDKAF